MKIKKIKYNLVAKALYTGEHGFRKQSIKHRSKKKYYRKIKHKQSEK